LSTETSIFRPTRIDRFSTRIRYEHSVFKVVAALKALGDSALSLLRWTRIRETLGVFLRTGGSFKAAAEELHLHSNSVKYRVQRAIDRRGRPISDGRLDIELALLLCHWYGSAVLHDE
jgi:DNA-binding PucR family transcriptional regulator